MNVEVDLADRAATVDYMVEESRLGAGVVRPFNAVEMRAFVERDFDRSGGYLSGANHSVLFNIGAAWRDRLHLLNRPLLVIHGTADPVFPQEHGEALAQCVSGAKLVTLDGGGHELHPGHWDRIIGAMIEHSDSVKSVPAQHMQEGKRS